MLNKHGEPGSSAASSSGKGKTIEAVEFEAFKWTTGLTDSEAALVKRLYTMDPGQRASESVGVLRSAEALLDHAKQRLALAAQPGTKEEINGLLIPFAEMLGCKVPGDAGLDLIATALAALPHILYPLASVRVASTHRYNRLPYPSDFLGAVGGELVFLERQQSMIQFQRTAIASALNRQARLPI